MTDDLTGAFHPSDPSTVHLIINGVTGCQEAILKVILKISDNRSVAVMTRNLIKLLVQTVTNMCRGPQETGTTIR